MGPGGKLGLMHWTCDDDLYRKDGDGKDTTVFPAVCFSGA